MPPLDMSPLPGGQLHKASPAGAGAAPPPPPPLFCSVPATDLIGAFRGLGLAAAEHGTPPAACPPLPAYADASACTSLASSAATADIGSPLTAFVAARERLLDRLGRPTPPDADPQPGSLAADAAAAQPAAVPLGNLRLQSQRTGHLLLKERLASTMQLCQRLHEQVGATCGWCVVQGRGPHA